jgi:hypothetical protein
VTGAAAATALPGAALAVYGVYQIVAGLVGHPFNRSMAETLGVIFLAFGLGVCWVARGLLRCEAWARTPSMMTFLLGGAVAYWTFQGGDYLAGAIAIVYGVGGITLLFWPGSHRVLTRVPRQVPPHP